VLSKPAAALSCGLGYVHQSKAVTAACTLFGACMCTSQNHYGVKVTGPWHQAGLNIGRDSKNIAL